MADIEQRNRENRKHKIYTESEIEQAKDFYTMRGVTNLAQLSRLLDIPNSTLKDWRDKGEWKSEVQTVSPPDMAFLHHMVRIVLSREVIALHDASRSCEIEEVRERTFIVERLLKSLELVSKAIEDTEGLTLEYAVRRLIVAVKEDIEIDSSKKEVFMAVLTEEHSKIMRDGVNE